MGHVVSELGRETEPKKIADIRDWPQPKTMTNLMSFLGFTNYYRKFIYRYAQVAKPFNKLISGENAFKKKRVVEWNSAWKEAFL